MTFGDWEESLETANEVWKLELSLEIGKKNLDWEISLDSGLGTGNEDQKLELSLETVN